MLQPRNKYETYYGYVVRRIEDERRFEAKVEALRVMKYARSLKVCLLVICMSGKTKKFVTLFSTLLFYLKKLHL